MYPSHNSHMHAAARAALALLCLLCLGGIRAAAQMSYPQFVNSGQPAQDSANYAAALAQYDQQKAASAQALARRAPAETVTNSKGATMSNAQAQPKARQLASQSCIIPRDASWTKLAIGDDNSSGAIPLGFNFDLYGVTYNTVYVNNNGNLTFTQAYGSYSSTGFPFAGVPMVAPFWADVDTRGPGNTGCGGVYYKNFGTRFVVTWENVGYYNAACDKSNTFQVVISTTSDPVVGLGQNVKFNFGDMNWTTGSASGGAGGFGGTAATAGVNKGADNAFIQIGRFGVAGTAYDGGAGATDGVDFLDYECYSFNVSNANNIPPSFSGLPSGNTLTLTCGQSATVTVAAQGPEVNQTVTNSVDLNGMCGVTATVNNSAVPGGISTATLNISAGSCNIGTNTITITATDNGTPARTSTATLTVIVNGPATPVISGPMQTCPGGKVTLTASGGTAYLWSTGETTASITVGGGSYSVTSTSASCSSEPASVTVTESDNSAPVPDVATLPTVNGVCAATVTAPTATDNCAGTITATTTDPTSYSQQGTYTVNWLYDDGNGNTSTQQQTVVVQDLTAPVPQVAVLPTITNECAVVLTAPKATDNCAGLLSATTTDPTTYTAQGTYTVNWVYSDGNGNSSTQQQTVVIRDVTAPTIANCPGNIVKNADAGKCTAKVDFAVGFLPPVVDQQRSDIYIGTTGNDQWQAFTAGKTGRLTGIDLFHNGCQATSFTMTIYAGTGVGGSVLFSGPYNYGTFCSSWFNVPIAAGSQPLLIQGQTYTFRLQGSGLGFVAGATSTPVPYYSSSYGLNPVYQGRYWSLDFRTYVSAGSPSASASDNCGVASFGSDHQSGDDFPVGVTTVTYTATDIAGNQATCSFTVTVLDNQKPSVTAPAAVTVSADAGACTASQVALGNPAASDNCGVASVSNNAPATFPVGSTRVTWTVTDIHGNRDTASQTVTVRDTEAPSVHTNSFAISLDAAGNASISAQQVNNGSTDNCGIAGIAIDRNSFDCASVGANTVTLTVTDIHGNSNSVPATITVEDHTAPSLVAPAAVTLNCHDDNSPAATGTATAADACGIASITHSDASTQDNDVNSPAHYNYSIARTWTATDNHGNSTQSVQTITVQDVTAPVLTNVTGDLDATAECSDASAIAAALAAMPAASDNCAPVAIHLVSDVTTTHCGTTYTRVRQWNFTDASGNTSPTFTQTLNVVDRTAPVVTYNAGSVAHCYDSSANNYLVAALAASDNCNSVEYTYVVTDASGTMLRSGNSDNASGSFSVGVNTIAWTVTDACGNSTTATTTVLINAPITASFNSFAAAGGNANTLYTSSYAPAAAAEIKVAAAGGTAPYTYAWSQSGAAATFTTGADASRISAKAIGSGQVVFTCVVTDSKGCQAIFRKTVWVVDVRCGQKGDKVLVCHGTGSVKNPFEQLCVAPAAVGTLLGNGDHLGTCGGATTRMIQGSTQPKPDAAEATVLAYPNPSHGLVSLRISGMKGALQLEVMDGRGNKVSRRSATVNAVQENVQLDLHGLAAGLYTVRISDGRQVISTRIVITR